MRVHAIAFLVIVLGGLGAAASCAAPPAPGHVSEAERGPQPPSRVLAAGNGFTCAIQSPGQVWCWGRNDAGQLGNGTTTATTQVTSVQGITDAVAVVAGYGFACALRGIGAVLCWGDNFAGQLGDGTTTARATPAAVAGLDDVRDLGAGLGHACAALADGTVRCWGWNGNGQLGDGSLIDRHTPTTVFGLGNVTAVAVGSQHSCALTAEVVSTGELSAANVFCWGRNREGELGNGTTTQSALPVAIFDASGLGTMALAAGAFHTCALAVDGAARCWGFNSSGQLGDGTTTTRTYMTSVVGLGTGTVTALAAGGEQTCAVRAGGQLNCWGGNESGQLGDGTTTQRRTPVLTPVANVEAVVAGTSHTCARSADGTLRCWGDNVDGDVGDGTLVQRASPTATLVLAATRPHIAAGSWHSCYEMSGTVSCWGRNGDGELGDGTTTSRSVAGTPVSLLTSALGATAGGRHGCALLGDGTARCWGENGYGQLGDGTTVSPRTAPVAVSGLAGARALAAGMEHSCALLDGGGVSCWGHNDVGQLGDGTTTSSALPRTVLDAASGAALTGIKAVAVDGFHACAIRANGEVACWGDNTNGQLGDGTTTTRTRAVAVVSADAMAATAVAGGGGQFSCALRADGTVRCWGAGSYGQLGDGTTTMMRTTPVTVGTVAGGVALSAGNYHACVVEASGTVKCWGANSYGQLGDGTLIGRAVAAAVALPGPAIDVACGLYHTCALLADGSAYCWGDNNFGQLGAGTDPYDTLPRRVAPF
jgi:alpha-tubulin suppressor-like RCC1 family protein